MQGMARRPSHTLGAILLCLFLAPPAARGTPERQALRQELRQGQWVQRERWLPAGKGARYQPHGGLKISRIGRALLVRAYIPTLRDGKPGILVRQLYRLAPRADHQTAAENSSRRAFQQMVQLARTEFLREPALSSLYNDALSSIARADPGDTVSVYRAAMRGLARGLKDAHTQYLEPSGGQRYLGTQSPETIGCGAMLLQQPSGGVLVQRVFPGSPARRGGLRVGDHVTAVNGQAVGNMRAAMDLLQGEAGDRVRLDVVRRGQPRRLEVTLGPYNRYPVRTILARGGYGVVRLPKFYEGSAADVGQAVSRLESRNGRPLRGLVLDFRGNPGGVRSEWLALVRQYVGGGSLGSNRGQGGRVVDTFAADPSAARRRALPLAVLVNGESASAAERVAGVLQDRGRALVIGDPTVGKQTGQRVQELADGSVFKLTTIKFHLPGGQPAGKVIPDVGTAEAKQRLGRVSARRMVDPVMRFAIAELQQRDAR